MDSSEEGAWWERREWSEVNNYLLSPMCWVLSVLGIGDVTRNKVDRAHAFMQRENHQVNRW